MTEPGSALVVPRTPVTRSAFSRLLSRMSESPELGVVVAVLVVFALFDGIQPRFGSIGELQNLGLDLAQFGILAIGESFVIITGGIDLSPGSLTALFVMLSVWLNAIAHVPTLLAFLITVLAGAAVGVWHGLFVTRLQVPAFVITLVTYIAAAGGALAISDGLPIVGESNMFEKVSSAQLLKIPLPTIIFVVIAAAAWFFLERTYLGRQVYAAGGNFEAARLAGIPVKRRIVWVYVVSGCCSAVVGILVASRLQVAEANVATGWELDAIAAAVIGGVSLFGGRGRIVGVAAGAALLVVLTDGLVVVNVSPYFQQIVLGGVLLVAITSDRLRARRHARLQ